MRFSLLLLIILTLLTMAATVRAEEEAKKPEPDTSQTQFTAIRMQGLDKITARRSSFAAMMGTVTRFGNLEVIPHACWQAPEGSIRPETAGLIEVWHWKPGDTPSLLFFGWMFASSPALSALESAQYDLTVLECLTELPEDEAEKGEKKAQ